ncbi:GAF domain-like protein [Cantharellus anzutake]|uniref:GAF domain-like protein n=1 Tax=Cantharellus anzutake TaxID=1750568 RepID=UPI001904660A|nr:GAF domain-like protein [Cantharellus anzutake]KAF8326621.1 GAF domain-like protein [Cantharellus anzutake]
MPHADASLVPQHIATKEAFWYHVYMQLGALLEGERNWVSNLSNAASLIYNSLLAFPAHFGPADRAVNWSGMFFSRFYLDAELFPGKKRDPKLPRLLLLGPFSGKPACQFIHTQAGKGVCADAFVHRTTVVVPDVDKYPGHIACDGETKSEIVIPLIRRDLPAGETALGVLDLDSLILNGFDDDDKRGLEHIADLIVQSCDWDCT